MTNYLLSVVAEAIKNHSYNWLITASLPPVLYFVTKKKKLNWLQRLLLKRALKRARKKTKSEWGNFFIKLLIALGVFGILLLFLDFGIAAALMLLVGLIIMNI